MFLDSIPMTTAKDALENISDEKLHNLMKLFLKSLDPVLLKAARRGSTNISFTDEQLIHSLSSTANDIAHKLVKTSPLLIFHKKNVFFLVRNY
jgi:hypothetical protein